MSTPRARRWTPEWVVLPGEIIREKFAEMGLTQKAAAEAMGVAQPQLSAVVNGGTGITARWALRLERLTGVSAETWMGLQMGYDLGVERARSAALGED